MPYIPKQVRPDYTPDTSTPLADQPGVLNYQITMLVDRFMRVNGLSYTNLNAAIGALECAKLELYRRVAVPYEDHKMKENGDVYTELW